MAKSQFVVRNSQLAKVPWNWVQGLLVGLLALLGADVIVGLTLGGLAEIATQTTTAPGLLSELVAENSVSGNFVFYAFSRLLGLAGIALFLRHRRAKWGSLGFKRFKFWQSVGLLLLSSLVLLAATMIVFIIVSQLSPGVNLDQAQDIVFGSAHTHLELGLAFMALVIIAPLAEEMIFRGFMLPAFAQKFGFWPAAIITSVLFGAVHMQVNVGIVTFLMALILAGLYKKTGSLWPAILFHSLKNLIAFLIIF